MIGIKSNTASDSGWDISFWFAILSPIVGVLLGFLAPFLIYH